MMKTRVGILALAFALATISSATTNEVRGLSRPNILFCIADDWGWPSAGVYGDWIDLPGFDRIVEEGVVFRNAFCNAPSCTPSRGTILTGRHGWTLEEGSTICGSLPTKFIVYPDVFKAAGYFVGSTGKGYGPASRTACGQNREPAGRLWIAATTNPPTTAMSNLDYAQNFKEFLTARPSGQPFCFWYGSFEPHEPYETGSGESKGGLNPADVQIHGLWSDIPEIRTKYLDYAYEVQYSDSHLVKMMNQLEAIGELDNTIVIVTGDNGMPFSQCKMHLNEWGVHVPFAVRWGDQVVSGRTVDDLVSFVDIAPTLLEAAEIEAPSDMILHGKSFLDILTSAESGITDPDGDEVLLGIDRHDFDFDDPARGIRTTQYLYIRQDAEWSRVDKPMDYEYLYDILLDDECLINLAYNADFSDIRAELRGRLEGGLRRYRDPRILGYGDIFFGNPYFGGEEPGTPYTNWVNNAVRSLESDSDHNGRMDLFDHYIGADLENGGIFQASLEDGRSCLQYTRTPSLASMSETVEWSADLLNWRTDHMTSTVGGISNGVQAVELAVTGVTNEQCFFRMTVEYTESNLINQ